MNTADDRAPPPPCDSPAPCPHRERCARELLACSDFRRYLNAGAIAVHGLRYSNPASRRPVPAPWLTPGAADDNAMRLTKRRMVAWQRKLDRLRMELAALRDEYDAGLIGRDVLLARAEVLNERVTELESKLTELRREGDENVWRDERA